MLGWGESVVEMVSADLRRAFPAMRGFSPFNLWRMRQLCLEYSAPEFLAQAVPETSAKSVEPGRDEFLSRLVRELRAFIPWGHHVELLKKVRDLAARHCREGRI